MTSLGLTAQSEYYDSGDLKKKTDARGKITEMTYDVHRRITSKNYNDATPDVTYVYYLTDAPNIGQLKSVSTNVATTTYIYDALGQVHESQHQIAGYPGTSSTVKFIYDWYLNGAPMSVVYPSGRTISYDIDDAGRTIKVFKDSSSNQTIYANLTLAAVGNDAYTADGRKAKMRLGNGLYLSYDYRPAGAVTSYRLGTTQTGSEKTRLDYSFHATQNNGNVQSQSVTRGGRTWTQSFTYDGVNRLLSANETGSWHRTYGYDAYGNRWVATSSGVAVDGLERVRADQFNTANNRLNGIAYDTAGNQTAYDGRTLEYDAEGRNTKVKNGASDYVVFTYDGEGRRVKKVSGGVTTYYVYNALGQLALERSNEPAANPGTSYLFTDMLGSVRTITNDSGEVVECYDYLPFGRLLTANIKERSAAGCYPTGPDSDSKVAQKFTGKERDSETGLDYFGARYMSSPQGRFMTPDPENAGATVDDPQSWNAYVYSRNNPLSYVDPDGLAYMLCTKDWSCTYDYSDADFYFNFQSDPDIYLSSTGSVWLKGELIGYYEHLNDDGFFTKLGESFTNNHLPDIIQMRADQNYKEGHYLAYGIDVIGTWLFPVRNYLSVDGALFVGSILSGGSSSAARGIIQSGGHTLLPRTAKLLNKVFGENITAREWGRALELLKKTNNIPPNFHGKIDANGNFIDSAGNVIDNIGYYLK